MEIEAWGSHSVSSGSQVGEFRVAAKKGGNSGSCVVFTDTKKSPWTAVWVLTLPQASADSTAV